MEPHGEPDLKVQTTKEDESTFYWSQESGQEDSGEAATWCGTTDQKDQFQGIIPVQFFKTFFLHKKGGRRRKRQNRVSWLSWTS